MSRIKRVLLVEDNPDVSAMLADYLEDAGMEAVVASSVGEAEKHFSQGKIEAILLDATLEEENDAVPFLQRVRAYDFRGPVIGISGASASNILLCANGANLGICKTHSREIIGALKGF